VGYCTVLGRTNDDSAYFIDWGDGSPVETCTSNVLTTHNYSFSAPALDGTLTSKGYKQALVRIYPNTGKTFRSMFFDRKPTTPSGLQTISSGWLDMNVNLPNLLAGATLCWGNTVQIRHAFLERVNITSWGAMTDASGLFRNCLALQSLNETEWATAQVTSWSSAFFFCSNLKQLDCSNWNVSSVTTFVNMFRNCGALERIPVSTWNTGACIDFSSMFLVCASLTECDVSNWNVSNGANFSNMFSACSSLKICNVRNWNVSNATNMNSMFASATSLQDVDISLWSVPILANATDMFASCFSIQRLENCNFSAATVFNGANGGFATSCGNLKKVTITGMNASINFSNCQLSASALDTIYTNLSATGTGKTITVTGNYGTASDNPVIATAKGWTVTG
jgi:surface protein